MQARFYQETYEYDITDKLSLTLLPDTEQKLRNNFICFDYENSVVHSWSLEGTEFWIWTGNIESNTEYCFNKSGFKDGVINTSGYKEGDDTKLSGKAQGTYTVSDDATTMTITFTALPA